MTAGKVNRLAYEYGLKCCTIGVAALEGTSQAKHSANTQRHAARDALTPTINAITSQVAAQDGAGPFVRIKGAWIDDGCLIVTPGCAEPAQALMFAIPVGLTVDPSP